MPLDKLNAFTTKVQDLADKPNSTMSAAELKAKFDAAPDELRLAFNQLIDDLGSVVDGDSGADNVGVTPIETSPSTLQGTLEWLKTQIDGTVLGQIPDGSVTPVKLSFDPATQLELNEHVTDYTQFKSSVKQKHKVSEDNGDSVQIDSGDLNNLVKAGFYTVHSGVLNTPSVDYYHVEILSHGDGAFVIQNAQNLFNDSFFTRRKQAGVWQPWSFDLFQSVVDGKNSLEVAIESNGGIVSDLNNPPTFADLVTGVNSLSGKISGTLPAGSNSRTVNTLPFSPSYVVLWATNPAASSKRFDIRMIRSTAFPHNAASGGTPYGTITTQDLSGISTGSQTISTSATFTTNGFTINGLDATSNYDFVAIK